MVMRTGALCIIPLFKPIRSWLRRMMRTGALCIILSFKPIRSWLGRMMMPGEVLTSTRLAVRKPGMALRIEDLLLIFILFFLLFPCRVTGFYVFCGH